MAAPGRSRGFLLCMAMAFGSALGAGYTDPQGRFSFEAPGLWPARPVAKATEGVRFEAPDGGASLTVVLAQAPTSADLGALCDGAVERSWPGLSTRQVGDAHLALAGRPVLRREYRATERGNALKVMAASVKVGSLAVTLAASASEAAFADTEKVFQRAVATLRFSSAVVAAAASEARAKLEALQAARDAGILTQEEHERKGAELEAELRLAAQQSQEAIRKKLQALEDAYAAGILTDEEYARKKAGLDAQLVAASPPLDDATRRKLEAIERAREAGILTQAEYEHKRGAVLSPLRPAPTVARAVPPAAPRPAVTRAPERPEPKQRPRPPRPAPAPRTEAVEQVEAPPETAPSPGALTRTPATPAPPVDGMELFCDLRGRFHFYHPPEWVVKDLPKLRGASLKRGEADASIMVLPWAKSVAELLATFAGQLREQTEGYQEVRRSGRRIAGRMVPLVEFTGIGPRGIPARSQVAVFVTEGTGYVFFLFAPEEEFADVLSVWDTVVSTFALGDGGGAAPAEGEPPGG